MDIRQARAEDAAAVARFICMAEGEMVELFTGYADLDKGAAEIQTLVESPEPSRYSLGNALVAAVDGVVAGAVLCFPADDQPTLDKPLLAYLNFRGRNFKTLFFEGVPGTYYLSTMGVDPACRGQGIGKALMTAAEQQGKAQGFEQASLLVSRDKDRARSLYERVGYAVAEEVAIASHPYYRMVKPL